MSSCALRRSVVFGWSAIVVLLSGCSDPSGEGSGGSSEGESDGSGDVPTGGPEDPCVTLTFAPVPASEIAWSGFPACDPQSGVCLVHPAPMHALGRAGMSPSGTAYSTTSNIVASWRGGVGAVHRLATRMLLSDVFAIADDDVWVVGSGSTVAHFDGDDWTLDEIPAGSWLSAVWASGPNDVWTVGNFGVIGHYDGAWTAVTIPGDSHFEDVAGTGPDDVWAVGSRGFDESFVMRWNGAAWTEVPGAAPTTLVAVWATGPSDVWAVGDGVVMHGDAMGLDVVDIPAVTIAEDNYHDVWGSSPSDVWITGDADMLHFDGTTWTRSEPLGQFVMGRGAEDVVVLGAAASRREGDAWVEEFAVGEPAVNAAWAVSEDDVWFVGDEGAVLRTQDGQLLRATLGEEPLRAIWASGAGDVWIASGSALLRGDGEKFCGVEVPGVSEFLGVVSISGSGSEDVWIATYEGVHHFDGMQWTQAEVANVGEVFAVSPTAAWAAGSELYRLDGTVWTKVAGGEFGDGFSVWGAADDDVWIAGDDKTMHWNGTTLEDSAAEISAYAPIAGSASDDIWSMSVETLHFDGEDWVEVPSGDLPIRALAVTASDVWGAGDGGLIVRKQK